MSTTQSVIELSRQEILSLIEQGAQQRLNMTARELIRAYYDGRLRDCGKIADLLSLAQLLDKDDPLFASA